MKQAKLIALTLLTLFALGAVAASAASGEEGFLPTPAKVMKELSKEVVFETHGKLKLQCTSSTGEGTFTNDSEGTGTITFVGCKAQGLTAKSLTAKEAGEITAAVKYQLCLNAGAYAVAITPTETVHVENTTVLLEVKGTVIGEVLAKSGEAKELYVVDFTGKEGLGNVTECKKGETTIKSSFELRIDPEAFQPASLKTTEALLQFGQKEELMAT